MPSSPSFVQTSPPFAPELSRPASHSATPTPRTSNPCASPASDRRSFTRDELIAIGQSRDPYRFIPLATQTLAHFPADTGLRFILATNYARLILPTLALEQLDQLPPAAQSDPSVIALRQALAQLPDDHLAPESLSARLTTNLRVLAARSDAFRLDLTQLLDQWSNWAASLEWFAIRIDASGKRTPPHTPANIFWRARSIRSTTSIPLRTSALDSAALLDHRSAANAVPLDFAKEPNRPPLTLEGLCPPWLFQLLYAATPDAEDGHRVPINLLQADPLELCTGLAMADLSKELADPRVRIFTGETAVHRFQLSLHGQINYRVLGPVAVSTGLATPCEPKPTDVMRSFQAAQVERQAALRAAVDAIYAKRTPAWYAERFSAAMCDSMSTMPDESGGVRGWAAREPSAGPSHEAAGGAEHDLRKREPLRILVPTCRFSSFVRHSASDIADAFTALGCEARVLVEPDEFTHLSGNAYFEAFAEFKPDLVVLINYTRDSLGNVIPPQVPFICWVQDPMPHLFDAQAGASQTPLDFLVGHTHRELFTRYGYPRERALGLPVLVNQHKFADQFNQPSTSASTRALKPLFNCELAYVSNHGQTPEQLRDSINGSLGDDRAARLIIEALYPKIESAVASAASKPLKAAMPALIRTTAIEVLGRSPEAPFLTRMLNNVVLPLADRLMRHQTLHWAADICERRGWRLRLFGRGWPKHPRFSAFAHPELDHAEQLRNCYQSAAVHIHASIHWMFHQRVLECASAGGLIAYRYKADDLRAHHAYVIERLFRDGAPSRPAPHELGVVRYDATDHPEALAYLALCQRLGTAPGQAVNATIGRAHPIQDLIDNRHGLSLCKDMPWFLGDPAQTCFHDATGLERIVEAAITRPDQREAIVRAVQARTLRHFTYQTAAERLIKLVRGSLALTSQQAATAPTPIIPLPTAVARSARPSNTPHIRSPASLLKRLNRV